MKKTNTPISTVRPKMKWLNRLDQVVQKNLAVSGFSNEDLAAQINISERHLFRQMKVLTGSSPQQYIRQYRLQQAKIHLKNGTYRTVKATARAVGYANTSYFISQFAKEFGRKPLEILREYGWR